MLSIHYVTKNNTQLTKLEDEINPRKPVSFLAPVLIAIPFSPLVFATKLLQVQYFHPYFQARDFTINNGIEAIHYNYLKNGWKGMYNLPTVCLQGFIVERLQNYLHCQILRQSFTLSWTKLPEDYVLAENAPAGENREEILGNVFNLAYPFRFTKYHLTNLAYKTAFIGGCFLLTSLITYPLESGLVRYMIDFQTDKVYDSLLDCFKQIWNNEGIAGFYKGWTIQARYILLLDGFVEAFSSMYTDTNKNLCNLLSILRNIRCYAMRTKTAARMIGYAGDEFNTFEVYSGIFFGLIGIFTYEANLHLKI